MSKQVLDKVLQMLPDLTPAERSAVQSRIGLLGCQRGVKSIDGVKQVHTAVSGILRGRFPPLKQLQQTRNWSKFEKGALQLMQFVDVTCGVKRGRQSQQVLTRLVDCVLLDLRTRGSSLGPVMVGDRMCQIDDVVDRCYPGYTEAGLLADALLRKG